MSQEEFNFDGPAYDPEHDQARLTGQIKRIFNCMSDGEWRTLGEIAGITNDPQTSVSAQLRHLRKPKFGDHTVNKQYRGERKIGLWEYQLIINEESLVAY